MKNGKLGNYPADYYEKHPSRFFSTALKKYDSPNGGGARHHPTKGFHLWRGESVAYLHALTILDAIFMIEKDLKASSASTLLSKYTTELDKLQPPLPHPKSCSKVFCDDRPVCYTDFTPHHNPSTFLHDIVVGETKWVQEQRKLCNFCHLINVLNALSMLFVMVDSSRWSMKFLYSMFCKLSYIFNSLL